MNNIIVGAVLFVSLIGTMAFILIDISKKKK